MLRILCPRPFVSVFGKKLLMPVFDVAREPGRRQDVKLRFAGRLEVDEHPSVNRREVIVDPRLEAAAGRQQRRADSHLADDSALTSQRQDVSRRSFDADGLAVDAHVDASHLKFSRRAIRPARPI